MARKVGSREVVELRRWPEVGLGELVGVCSHQVQRRGEVFASDRGGRPVRTITERLVAELLRAAELHRSRDHHVAEFGLGKGASGGSDGDDQLGLDLVVHLLDEPGDGQRGRAGSGGDTVLVEVQFGLHAQHRLRADAGRVVRPESTSLAGRGAAAYLGEVVVEVAGVPVPAGPGVHAGRQDVGEREESRRRSR